RSRRAGAVVQIHQEIIDDIGELVVLSDPAGAYFGLVDPGKAT
ncbi:MAG: VOC family protein, partial [Silicimonas sp.]|nr:VOC family protein [Silicimonas sp.]